MDVNASLNAVRNETTPALLSWRTIGKLSNVLTAMTIAIGVTGVLGNALVVVIVVKYKILFQQVKSSYIINQSFIDGLTSALLILTHIFGVHLTERMENLQAVFFCRLWATQFLPWGLMVSSTYNLMAISVERYMAIVHPLWHMNNFTDSKTRVSVVFIWLFGVLYVGAIVIPTTGVVNRKCLRAVFWPSRSIAVVVGLLQLCVTLVLPLITHGFCYARILKTLRNRCPREERCMTPSSTDIDMATTQEQSNIDKRTALEVETDTRNISETGTKEVFARKDNASKEGGNSKYLPTISDSTNTRELALGKITANTSLSAVNQQGARHRHTKKAEKNVIKTLAIITVCFFICWIPNKIHTSLILAGVTNYIGDIFQVTTIFVFGNCCINPLIYIAKYDAFKTGLRALFRRE